MAGLSRKTVTVLFSDVVDSTPLGEAVDPESVRELMARYFEEMRPVIERHGGTVEKYIGDEIMAVFGVPQVHEDDALRAVRAACEMREALGALNRDLPQAISVRTALNTGEVVAGDRHTLVTGDAVNTAARLRAAAAPGELLVGSKTYDLVRDAVVAEPLEPLDLKGKSAPVTAWRIVAVLTGMPGRARRLDSDLVGRQTELALLRQAYARAVGQRASHLFTILGPAGVGKSRLANELIEIARPEATVLLGRCLPYGEGITFWPLRDIVHQITNLAELIGATDIAAIASATGGESEEVAPAKEIFRAVRLLVEAVARKKPLVLALDDLHWAEPTFLDLVEHLSDTIRETPVLLVCLARQELIDGRPMWAGGKVNATTILLDPLDAEESDLLVDNLGGDEMPTELRRTITEVAEGNPFFLEEMVAMVAEDPTAATLPPTVHALLTARLERLEPREREVVGAASVVGRFFTREAVAALVQNLNGELDSLQRKELIRAHPVPFAHGEAYRFRHVLIRDAAYDALPKAVRAGMHERVADFLALNDSDIDELIGWHLEQAVRYRADLGTTAADLARRASLVLGAAGQRAFARDDAPAAVTLLERATALLGEDDSERTALLAELGSALIKTGEFGRAEATLAEAITSGEPRIRLRARVDQEFVRSYLHPETGSESLVRVADEVIPELEQLGDDLGLAKAWWLLSEAYSIACRWGQRAEALERALVHARRAEAEQAATYIGLLAQALYYGPTPVSEALDRCETLLADVQGDRALEAALTGTLAGLHAMRGKFDDARRLWAQAAARYDDLGLRFRRAARSLLAAEIESLAGDDAAAERELRFGYETLEAMGERAVRSTISAFLARTLVVQGRFDDAEPFIRFSGDVAAEDDLVTQIVIRTAQAEVCANRGDLASALQLVHSAVELADDTDFLDLQAQTQLSLASVLAQSGRSQESAAACAQAVETFERKGNLVAASRSAARQLASGG